MAADLPVLWNASAETGVRLDAPYLAVKAPYSGAGTQREARWQVSKTNSFPATATNAVFDSGLRENDDREQGDDWIEIPVGLDMPGLAAWAASTTYYVSCLGRNTSSESSSWATAISFTTEAAKVTAATWANVQ